tara:strand:+ start:1038 stop:1229 length:192 start_codon:yes stop_codon:yes gene_type:complete
VAAVAGASASASACVATVANIGRYTAPLSAMAKPVVAKPVAARAAAARAAAMAALMSGNHTQM